MTNSPGSGPVVFLMCPGMLLLLEKQIVSAAPLESGASYTQLPPARSLLAQHSWTLAAPPFPMDSPAPGSHPSRPTCFLSIVSDQPPTDWWPSAWWPSHSSLLSRKISKYVQTFLPNILPYKKQMPNYMQSRFRFLHKCCNLNNVECILNLFPSKRCQSISILRGRKRFWRRKYEEGPKQESGVLQKS